MCVYTLKNAELWVRVRVGLGIRVSHGGLGLGFYVQTPQACC